MSTMSVLKPEVIENFKHFLVGEPRQFLVYQGDVYCLREGCSGCPYESNGDCEYEDSRVPVEKMPNARLGVGFESSPFLVLELLDGVLFEDVPRDLWNTPWDNMFLDPLNDGYVIASLEHPFRVMKGQIRFYGTRDLFDQTRYSDFFRVQSDYKPEHRLVAYDFSAIEPRILTVASQESNYLEVFNGVPKVMGWQVSVSGEMPAHVIQFNGGDYCYLDGGVSSTDVTFFHQCGECPARVRCQLIGEPILKMIATDWHAKNSEAFFGAKFVQETDKFKRKLLRTQGKTAGLALVYGATEYAISKSLGITKEEASRILGSFFMKLRQLQRYMDSCQRYMQKHGVTNNLFGRYQDLSHNLKGSDSSKNRGIYRGLMRRLSLNYPTQSSAAEVLKIATIRVSDWLEENGLSILLGLNPPERVQSGALPSGILVHPILSVHDEICFMMRDNAIQDVKPYMHKVLQLDDVMKSFGVDFNLELDIEWDDFRCWTSSIAEPQGRLFVQKYLLGLEQDIQKNVSLIIEAKDWDLATWQTFNGWMDTLENSGGMVASVEGADGIRMLGKNIPLAQIHQSRASYRLQRHSVNQ